MSEKIFGLHSVAGRLNKAPETIRLLQVLNGRHDRRLQSLVDQARQLDISIEPVGRDKLTALAGGHNHQGIVAHCTGQAPSYQDKDLIKLIEAQDKPLVLVLDGVQDPHNLGACLRSADAAGVTVVIAPRDRAAPLNATAIKVACGAADNVPFIAVANLARSLKQLKEAGVWLVGMADDTEQMIYDVDLNGPTAIIMGAEGEGLRHLTREHCDFMAKLPMSGSVSSLNVSVATGVSLFEVIRQRMGSS